MAQRLTRAKQTIKSAGRTFPELTADDRAARLPTVLKVLYLIFSEGYTASGGDALYRLQASRCYGFRQFPCLLRDLCFGPDVASLRLSHRISGHYSIVQFIVSRSACSTIVSRSIV